MKTKSCIFLLLLITCCYTNLFAQFGNGLTPAPVLTTTPLVVNQYYQITTVYASLNTSSGNYTFSNNLVKANLTPRNGVPMPSIGSLVLLINMESNASQAGKFTFGTLSNIENGSIATIRLLVLPISSPQNSFAFLDSGIYAAVKKQLIVVPQYTSLDLSNGSLTALPYEETTSTGGILSFFVKGTLTWGPHSVDLDTLGFSGVPEPLVGTAPGTAGIGGIGGNFGTDCTLGLHGLPGGYDHQVWKSGICGSGDGGSRGNPGIYIPLNCDSSLLTPGMMCDTKSKNSSVFGSGVYPKQIALGGGGYKGKVGHVSYSGAGGGGGIGSPNNGFNATGIGGFSGYGGSGKRGGGSMIYAALTINYTLVDTPYIRCKGKMGSTGSAGTNATNYGGNGGVGGGGGGNGATGGNGGKGGGGGAGGFVLHILGPQSPALTANDIKPWSDNLGGKGGNAGAGGIGGFPGNNAPGICGTSCPNTCICDTVQINTCVESVFDWLKDLGSAIPSYSMTSDPVNNKKYYWNSQYECVLADEIDCFVGAKILQCQNKNPASIAGILPTEVRRITILPSLYTACSFSIEDLILSILNGGHYDTLSVPGYIIDSSLNCGTSAPFINPRWELTCSCNRAQPIFGDSGSGEAGDDGEEGNDDFEEMPESYGKLSQIDTGIICSGKSKEIFMYFYKGTPPYTAMIYDGSNASTYYGCTNGTTISVSPSTTTTYSLIEVTDSNGMVCNSVGCNMGAVTIHVNPSPLVGTSTINASICEGASTTITANGAVTYTWQPGSLSGTSVTFTPANSTTYTVTGTNALGCTKTATRLITVNLLPSVGTTTANNTVCAGTATTITGTGATTYAWQPGALFGTSVIVFPASTTTYTVTGTNALGCTKTSSRSITVNPLPLVGSTATQTTICVGASTSITGTGAITYTWQPGAFSGTTITVSPSATTTYTVTGTGVAGCTQTSTITITVVPCVVSVLNLKLYIEGYYLAAGFMDVVLLNQGEAINSTQTDTIVIELHNAFAPYILAASTKAVLNTNGVASAAFAVTGNYYIAIKHRNGLQTWSANPITLGNGNTFYDFSNSASKAYGDNQTEVEPGIWAFYSGDLNQDENIDLLDISELEDGINTFQFGYTARDINGDGNVDLLDTPVLEGNVSQFIFANRP